LGTEFPLNFPRIQHEHASGKDVEDVDVPLLSTLKLGDHRPVGDSGLEVPRIPAVVNRRSFAISRRGQDLLWSRTARGPGTATGERERRFRRQTILAHGKELDLPVPRVRDGQRDFSSTPPLRPFHRFSIGVRIGGRRQPSFSAPPLGSVRQAEGNGTYGKSYEIPHLHLLNPSGTGRRDRSWIEVGEIFEFGAVGPVAAQQSTERFLFRGR